jgi:DNA repair protein RecN (Recombination protein N)
MLAALRIRNLAIIEDLELAFEPGFNVITGETGAGKTILMRALGLLLGDRGGGDLVREGAREAEVEALFTGPVVAAVLAVDATEDGDDEPAVGDAANGDGPAIDADELAVRRIVAGGGRQRAYVNDRLATVARLAALGGRLVHVYGQHEHHTLLGADTQRRILDDSAQLEPLVETLRARAAALAALEERMRLAREGADALAARRDLLAYQVEEIRRVAPRTGEADELTHERELLRHADRLHAAAAEGEQALYGGDGAVLDTLTRLAKRLQAAGAIDPELGAAAGLLEEARPAIEEAALRLRARAAAIAADPARLADVEERLAVLARLARKHGCAAGELEACHTDLEAELTALDGAAADPEALARTLDRAAAEAWDAADALSAARREAATALAVRITRGLGDLALGSARFSVTLEPIAATATTPESRRRGGGTFVASGAERVVFELAPNRGEPPRPLARIASGGELSRVMLALKTATVGQSDVPTVLFDEVDAGIGGAVAEAVGRKLAQLGRSRQVICITHLPQIAACADHHFVVRKQPARGRTRSSAERLSDAERIEELARMVGGARITDEARRHAAELRRQAAPAPGRASAKRSP